MDRHAEQEGDWRLGNRARIAAAATTVCGVLRSWAVSAYRRIRFAAAFVKYLVLMAYHFPNWRFLVADAMLTLKYGTQNPYKICLDYLKHYSTNEVQKAYGETRLRTLEKIAEMVNLTENDVLYDLGCGRGRCIFWFHLFFGCRAIGVEITPVFIERAEAIRKRLKLDGIEFRQAMIQDQDLSDATVVYLYGTCFKPEAIVRLFPCLARLPPGARVVSVTHPLDKYTPALFERVAVIDAPYSWGNSPIYILRRRSTRQDTPPPRLRMR